MRKRVEKVDIYGWTLSLLSLTNRSYTINFDDSDWPMFCGYVPYETSRWLLSYHLSYEPPISWRIVVWSGGRPRKFTRLKKFTALEDTIRVYFARG